MYVLIAKNVELELAPVTPNPTVVGQFYKYMSFFSSVFIYLTPKSCRLNVLCSVCAALHTEATLTSRGWAHGFSFPGLRRRRAPGAAISAEPLFFPSRGAWNIRSQGSLERCKSVCECHSCFHNHKRLKPLSAAMFKDDREKSLLNKTVKGMGAK